MNKRIGIVGWKTSSDSFGITLPYASFFSQFGTLEIIMPNEVDIRKGLDLLVLPGGPDVDPMRYLSEKEAVSFEMGSQCPFRERFDVALLPKYVDAKTPIFGVCRGHQSFAVFNNGTLVQHMEHETNPSHDRNKKVHTASITEDGKMYIPMGFEVNSIHHQIVDEVPGNAVVLARHSVTKEIEALGYIDYPAFSVQWHPEQIKDKFSINLIEELLSCNGVTTLMNEYQYQEELS